MRSREGILAASTSTGCALRRINAVNAESEDAESGGRVVELDSTGLGFSRRGSRVFVHYPNRGPDGTTIYGSGIQIPYPFGDPSANEITRERVRIIEALGDAE
jgi:hypothetical protein